MRVEAITRLATAALLAAGTMLISATVAAAAVYDCRTSGRTLSVVIADTDPYRATVVGNQNGVADPTDVKFVMEVIDGGFAASSAQFLFQGPDAGALQFEGMEYDCRVPAKAAPAPVRSLSAGPLLETPGQSYGGKVRSGPGTQHPQIGSLHEGDRIKIIRNAGVRFNGYDWFEVQQGDLIGYQWGGVICSNQPVDGVFQQCAP